jgi:hypothetical protein
MRSTIRVSLPCLVLCLILAAALMPGPNGARADDWPIFRHDARRTGASSATVPIDRPAVLFRTYLGGALGAEQFLDYDVDGDGRAEIVYVSGGRVVAKRGNNLAVWESDILPVDRLWGAVDFDDDGVDELLLTRTWPAPSQLVLISSVDGSLVWSLPAGTTDWFGGVRVGDLDADGHPDLYVGSGMCGTGVTGPPGTALSFCASGACDYASARTLWTLGAGTGNCGAGGALGDVDGDGAIEMVLPWEYAAVPVYAGATGAREGELPSFATGTYDRATTSVMLENLDADPALEALTYTNAFNAGQGARRVAVFDHDGAAYRLLWEHVGVDRAADRVTMDAPGSIADLDGDGSIELVVSRFLGSSGAWTTTVHDAVSGAVRATLPDSVALGGVVDVTGDDRPEILATIGGAVRVYQFASDAVTETFRVDDRAVVRVSDATRRASEITATRVFTMQLDDDAPAELILGENGPDGRLVALHAYDADGATPVLLGSFRAPAGVNILVANEVGPMTRDHRQPVVATSDGYLLILDRALAVTNRVEAGEFQEPGMRVGGFYTGAQGPLASPLVGAFSDGASILTPDSRGALVRLDASAASPIAQPLRVDEIFGARWASIVDLDGAAPRELLTYEGSDLVIRAAAPGLSVVRRTSAGDQGFRADPMPATGPSGERRVVITRQDAAGQLRLAAYDAATLTERWATTPILPGWGVQNHGLAAIADVTGDGVDDVATVINSVLLYDGASGAQSWSNGPFMAGADPMIASVDGDATPEVVVHGAWQASRLVSAAGATRWNLPAVGTQVNGYGALVSCAGRASVVAGESGSPELFTIRGDDGAVIARRLLANGASHDPAAVPAGATPGIAGNVTAVASLGSAAAPAVLVGSTDGWLYALDPCSLAIVWSVDLRYPVGEPIVADLNGDGEDEIVVSVADGYLVGIGGAAYDAPLVRDVEAGAPATDIDEIDTFDTLFAAWDAVPGASSYIVSVFTEYGSEVRFPNAADVGNVIGVTIPMLALAQGQRYVISVQAVGPDGPGLEGRSDGVTVVDTQAPDATVTVRPRVSWPPNLIFPTVDASCTDRVGLARIETSIEETDGTAIETLEGRDVTGRNATSSTRWMGLILGLDAPAGTYMARVTCTDLSGHTTTATSELTLDPSAVPVEADAGVPVDGGAAIEPGGDGCGCRAAPRGGAPLGTLLMLALVLWRRRR